MATIYQLIYTLIVNISSKINILEKNVPRNQNKFSIKF